jgi:homoserine kinase
MGRRRLVRVPGSTANLGPGYDVLAAAVSLQLELEVTESGEFSLDTGGLEVSADRDNLVVRAFETLHSADDLSFAIRSDIPLARGLGSSAAAIVAGLAAADHMYELALSRDDLVARATQLEGHPDNVAASIHGGFVISGPDGGSARFEGPEGLEAVALIPDEEVPTAEARAAIPDTIPLADAVANIGAVATLVLGLRENDPELIRRGLADALHQDRRRALYSRSMEIVDAATEIGALGATISGAGPTVILWTTWQDAGRVSDELRSRAEGWAEVRRLPFTPLGLDVPEL